MLRTTEVEETYMARRGFGQERRDVPVSAVGKDSDEALHRIVQICRSAGIQTLATVYKRKSNVPLLTSC